MGGTRASLLLSAVLVFAACGVAEGVAVEGDDSVGQVEGELRALTAAEVVGDLVAGVPQTTTHSGTPRYRAYRLTVTAGQRVDLWVRSANGDAQAWLLGSNFQTLVSDTAAAVTDAHLTRTLGTAGMYYVAFREAHGHAATFTVTLAAPQPVDAGTPAVASTLNGWEWQNPLPQGNALRDVWSSGAGDLWAVGEHGTLVHSTGSDWAPVASGTSNELFRVWGTGPRDVWAVGEAGLVLHYDGVSWTSTPGLANATLSCVFGSGPNDVWVAGQQTEALHWDGAHWVSVTLGDWLCYGGWSAGPHDAWLNSAEGLRHWDGFGWARETPAKNMSAFGGVAANDLWSFEDNILEPSGISKAHHWDGTRWSDGPSLTFVSVRGVWGKRSNDVWTVGDHGEAMHWDGQAWSWVDVGTGRDLTAVFGVGSSVWAVGASGTILRHR